jgi:hypothetical protein
VWWSTRQGWRGRSSADSEMSATLSTPLEPLETGALNHGSGACWGSIGDGWATQSETDVGVLIRRREGKEHGRRARRRNWNRGYKHYLLVACLIGAAGM